MAEYNKAHNFGSISHQATANKARTLLDTVLCGASALVFAGVGAYAAAHGDVLTPKVLSLPVAACVVGAAGRYAAYKGLTISLKTYCLAAATPIFVMLSLENIIRSEVLPAALYGAVSAVLTSAAAFEFVRGRRT